MRKLKPHRERLLFLLLAFRCIPKRYLTKAIVPKGNRNNYDALYSLYRHEYLNGFPALDYTVNLFLEPKGYKYLEEKLFEKPLQYKYLSSRQRRLFGGHHYIMNLQFAWDYINKAENWKDIVNTELYADVDINNCKLKFPYQTGEIEIRPDILIKTQENGKHKKLVLVENDTTTENTIKIYRKILRYAFYLGKIEKNHSLARDFYYPKVELYFVFLSKERMKNMFYRGTLSRYFKYTNTFRGKYHIDTKDIIRIVQSDFFSLYIKCFHDDEFTKKDFAETLRLNSLFKNMR